MKVYQEALSSRLDNDVRTKLKSFIAVTNLFDQIYLAQDVAS